MGLYHLVVVALVPHVVCYIWISKKEIKLAKATHLSSGISAAI